MKQTDLNKILIMRMNSGTVPEALRRQYVGELGKIDNGIVVVTTHLSNNKIKEIKIKK